MFFLNPFNAGVTKNTPQPAFTSRQILNPVASVLKPTASLQLYTGLNQDHFQRINYPPVRFGSFAPPPGGDGEDPFFSMHLNYAGDDDPVEWNRYTTLGEFDPVNQTGGTPPNESKADRTKRLNRESYARRMKDQEKAKEIKRKQKDSKTNRRKDPVKLETIRAQNRTSDRNRRKDLVKLETIRAQNRNSLNNKKNNLPVSRKKIEPRKIQPSTSADGLISSFAATTISGPSMTATAPPIQDQPGMIQAGSYTGQQRTVDSTGTDDYGTYTIYRYPDGNLVAEYD